MVFNLANNHKIIRQCQFQKHSYRRFLASFFLPRKSFADIFYVAEDDKRLRSDNSTLKSLFTI